MAACLPAGALPIHGVQRRGVPPAGGGPPHVLLSSCFHRGPEWGLCLGVLGDMPGSVGAACGTGRASPPQTLVLMPFPWALIPSSLLLLLAGVSHAPTSAPLHLLFPLPARFLPRIHTAHALRGRRSRILGGTFPDLPAISLPCFLSSVACI